MQTTSNITDQPIPAALERRVLEKLITARVGLLMKKPFYGKLAVRLTMTPADSFVPTAATDGRKFYYNHKFVDSLQPAEVEFLVGHEIMHCVYDHMDRKNCRDKQIWNIAADYVVNQDLVDQNVGKLITTVPALYDPKYKGMVAEEVYDILFKDAKKISISSLLQKVLDDHLDGDGDEDENDSNSSPGKNGNGKSSVIPKLTEEEKKQIRDEIREAVINVAQSCEAGEIPGGVKRFISDLTSPQMNWRELLRTQLESTLLNDYSWLRPDRKGWGMDAIMPGMVQDESIDIACCIDMSGSIGQDQAKDFLSEVQGIMDQFSSYKIHVWCFDTQVYNPKVYTNDDSDGIQSYNLAGGGGTDFMCNWAFMKNEDLNPKRLIMFTDGYPCGSWGDPNYCPTIFIIHNGGYAGYNGHAPEAPFGVSVQYQANAK